MAADDSVPIADLVAAGNLEQFVTLVDRLHQGILNALLAMRLVSGAPIDDLMLQPMGQPLIDPSERLLPRQLAGRASSAPRTWPSAPTSSAACSASPASRTACCSAAARLWASLFAPLKSAFPDGLDRQMVLALLQILWDRTEPTGYSQHHPHRQPARLAAARRS